jgi:hypothetical protein
VTGFSYLTRTPGEKHVTLTATGSCGTDIAAAKYHVKQCTIDVPVIVVDRESVDPGAPLHASIALPAGHTARRRSVHRGDLHRHRDRDRIPPHRAWKILCHLRGS